MKNHIKSFVTLVVALLFFSTLTFAAVNIQGIVIDKSDREPLIGANVMIMDSQIGVSTNSKGEFILTNVSPGQYILAINHIGYKIEKRKIITGTQNLNLKIELDPSMIKGQEIIVTANRAIDRESPVAFTDLSRKEIESKYYAQEIPLLLQDVPGVYAYTYTGSGLGYSEIKIRGFDATRVGVSINDVPLNDPEDHVTYFYDLPDVSANVHDIQVQRGAGMPLYGTGAVAGSVNLTTTAAGQDRYISYNTVLGSYNTEKHTFSLGSGLINNTYSFYGRFSKVKTDGYRDNSWVDSWSYYFSASRYDHNLTTTINLFGGPMRAHFAWEGITREELATNRTLNYDNYPEAADNFNQPHYQLINEWTPSDNLTVKSTLFHVKGDGYYEQFKTNRKLVEYNMSPFEQNGATVSRTDLVRQKWVDKKQYGWIPRLEIKTGRHKISTGAELSLFKAHHWGQVTWGANLPPGTNPNGKYYEYDTSKNSAALFINELYTLSSKIYLKADLQYQHHSYDFDQEKMGAFYGHKYSIDYNFFTPRFGINYNINPALNFYSSYSMAKKEPKDSDIYDNDDPDVLPLFKNIDPENGIYEDPYIKPETLNDFEAGIGYKKKDMEVKLNGYWMIFNDEIVPTGGLTDDGYPIYGNAEKSYHRGIEADLRLHTLLGFQLSTNFSYSDNYFVDYTEYFWNEDYSGNVSFDRTGNTIAGFPEILFNARLSKTIGPLFASAHVQHIGRIYLDNSQQKDLSIDPYNVVNISASYKLPNWFGPLDLSANLFINNIFDVEYEVSGYTWAGVGYYIPAAKRNYYFSLQTQL